MDRIKKYFSSVYGIIVIIVTLASLYAIFFPTPLNKLFQSQHEKFIDENYIIDVLPPFRTNHIIKVSYGEGSYLEMTDDNIDIEASSAGCFNNNYPQSDNANYLGLKIRNNSFLISLNVRDFKTGKIIAAIEDNQWLVKKSLLNFHNDTNSLEIYDEYGYVAFSLWVDINNIVQIRGYFVGNVCTMFNDGGVTKIVGRDDPKYEEKCLLYASKLKPRFKRFISEKSAFILFMQ